MRVFLQYFLRGKEVLPLFNRDDTVNPDTDIAGGNFIRTRIRQILKDGDGYSKQRCFIVSTTFLSIDHSFVEGGLPILFETMVFEEVDGIINWSDLYCKRYSDYDDAVQSHLELVGEINAGRQTFEERSNV
jgi:hypothetical protein